MKRFNRITGSCIFVAIICLSFSSFSWAADLSFKDLLKEKGSFYNIPPEKMAIVDEMDAHELKLMKLGVHSLRYTWISGNYEIEEKKMAAFLEKTKNELKLLTEDKAQGQVVDLDLVKTKIESLDLVSFSWCLTLNDEVHIQNESKALRRSLL